MAAKSCSPSDTLKVIGTWVSIAGAVLIAIAETLSICTDNDDASSQSSYMIDVRPVQSARNKN